jgi:hypothetical protein
MGEKWPRILLKVTTSTSLLGSCTCRKTRQGTDGFTSPPKEGVLRIFLPEKFRRLRPGLNPRTWVPKASTLPLDHRSRLPKLYLLFIIPLRRFCLLENWVHDREAYTTVRKELKSEQEDFQRNTPDNSTKRSNHWVRTRTTHFHTRKSQFTIVVEQVIHSD